MKNRKEEGNFGEFGNVDRRRFTPAYILKLIFIATILLAIPTALGGWKQFYLSVLEKQKPKIKLVKTANGIGLAKQNIEIEISDNQSGLKDVEISLLSNNKTEVLLKKSYEKKSYQDLIKLELEPREHSQDNSTAELQVELSDRSYWKNVNTFKKKYEIDLSAPKIELLSKTKNLTQGQAAFVSYKIDGESRAVSSYVVVGDNKYLGFKYGEDSYFAYYSIPLDCFACEVNVEAKDFILNSSNHKVNYELTLYEQKNIEIALSSEFIENYKKYAIKAFEKEVQYFDSGKLFISGVINDLETEKKAKVLFARPALNKYWNNEFYYPGGKMTKIDFASVLNYKIDGQELGSYVSPGIFFKDDGRNNGEIRAANTGRVIFSGDFGILGKTIILDHGFGLSSAYSSLSKLEKREGDIVTKGDVIAFAGDTGLFNQKGCMYQVRLHGIPVNPDTWWDKEWISDNI